MQQFRDAARGRVQTPAKGERYDRTSHDITSHHITCPLVTHHHTFSTQPLPPLTPSQHNPPHTLSTQPLTLSHTLSSRSPSHSLTPSHTLHPRDLTRSPSSSSSSRGGDSGGGHPHPLGRVQTPGGSPFVATGTGGLGGHHNSNSNSNSNQMTYGSTSSSSDTQVKSPRPHTLSTLTYHALYFLIRSIHTDTPHHYYHPLSLLTSPCTTPPRCCRGRR